MHRGGCGMKIRIEFEEELKEDEIVIRCREMNDAIKRIHKFIADVSSKTAKLTFFKDNSEYYLPLDDILFFETSDNGICSHTIDEVYRVKIRLYELEELLPYNFIRVSKSTILNINHIFSINRNLTASSLVEFYKSHKQVYVSRLYFKALRQRLDERRNHET